MGVDQEMPVGDGKNCKFFITENIPVDKLFTGILVP
jgi:hypothetical protein